MLNTTFGAVATAGLEIGVWKFWYRTCFVDNILYSWKFKTGFFYTMTCHEAWIDGAM